MRNRMLVLHAVTAQLVIVLLILIKVLFVPYLVWQGLGTSPPAMIVLDLFTIVFGTFVALLMGLFGYYQARFFQPARFARDALRCMLVIHGPVALFLLYKGVYGAAWDTDLLLILSGWTSLVSHPMHLVGLFGSWVDGLALFAMAGCYLLGSVLFYDETRIARLPRKQQKGVL